MTAWRLAPQCAERWSLNAVPLPCFTECGWGVYNRHVNRDLGPWRQFKFWNRFACPLNLLTLHSATQWGEECLGIGAVPLVSVYYRLARHKIYGKIWCVEYSLVFFLLPSSLSFFRGTLADCLAWERHRNAGNQLLEKRQQLVTFCQYWIL